ncbi:MAG: FKBP-type peptidyl-prolyl cis-trans isomerase [Bacteroidota bacterium]
MNLIEIGEEEKPANTGDFILLDINYATMDDSVFFKARRMLKLESSPYEGSVNTALMQLSKGDSAALILNAEKFFNYTLGREIPDFLKEEEKIKINVRIQNVQTPEDFEKEKAMFLKWVEEFQLSEIDRISRYLNENQIDIELESNGIYFLSWEKGTGPPVEKGKHIWIHYEGKFLNGEFIDSSKRRNVPLDFIYGNEMYLIKGLEYAVGRMREGGKAMVLIPSELGFGPSGSAFGIVPPYTAMIYLIEVIKVK